MPPAHRPFHEREAEQPSHSPAAQRRRHDDPDQVDLLAGARHGLAEPHHLARPIRQDEGSAGVGPDQRPYPRRLRRKQGS
jgi:hypothetical protein